MIRHFTFVTKLSSVCSSRHSTLYGKVLRSHLWGNVKTMYCSQTCGIGPSLENWMN